MRLASHQRQFAIAQAELDELERTDGSAIRKEGHRHAMEQALADDPGLPNPLIDDGVQQNEGVVPDDRYSMLQVQLARKRHEFRHLQSQGARREKLAGLRALLPSGDDGPLPLGEIEAMLEKKAIEIRMIEEALIKYCAELVRVQRGRKDPSPPRLGHEEAQRMSLRYLDRDGSDAPAGARGRNRTGPTGATIHSADLGVAAVRPS
jgi:hypothetical protein